MWTKFTAPAPRPIGHEACPLDRFQARSPRSGSYSTHGPRTHREWLTWCACSWRSAPWEAGKDDDGWSVLWGSDEILGLTGGDPSFALSAEGLHRSRDGRATWSQLPLDLPSPDVRDGFREAFAQAGAPADEVELRSLPPGRVAAAVVGPDGDLLLAMYDLEQHSLSLWRHREAAEQP